MQAAQSIRIGFDVDYFICDTHGRLIHWAETTFGLNLAGQKDLPIHDLLAKAQAKLMLELLNEGSFFAIWYRTKIWSACCKGYVRHMTSSS